MCPHRETPRPDVARIEMSAEHCHPLAHSDQPPAPFARRLGHGAGTVIDDRDRHFITVDVDIDARARMRSVLGNIGQGLLDDPVRRPVDERRKAGHPLDPAVTGPPGWRGCPCARAILIAPQKREPGAYGKQPQTPSSNQNTSSLTSTSHVQRRFSGWIYRRGREINSTIGSFY